ncbi:MAG: DNA repair protein RadC [Acidobacteriota bacterium]
MPPASRPREKLLVRGVGALRDADLLALLLGGGTKEENVLKIASRLLRKHGRRGLLALDASGWMAEKGIGPARAARLLAGLELGRRGVQRELAEPPQIVTPAAVFQQVRHLARARKEHLVGLYLDSQNRLLAVETLSIGSLNTTRTHPREILEPALRHLALGFILVHNHPSGSLVPSSEDMEFTRGVARAAALMDLLLHDHLVISRRGYVSLKEQGLMPDATAW